MSENQLHRDRRHCKNTRIWYQKSFVVSSTWKFHPCFIPHYNVSPSYWPDTRPFLSKRTFHERFCRNSLSNWALLPQGPLYRWKYNSFQTMNMIIAFKVIHCLQFLLIQVSTFKIICSLIHLIISYHQESYRHLDASHC